ncbi:MAG: hypothetical protein DCF22_11960 [Leptolyngbya sp.]|nr:MAG: hypothetical protein DCF22_11960 [Leptolyngbya sp.]
MQSKPATSKPLYIRQVTLHAREEKRPPIGSLPKPNRNIGFASVFLKIENPQAVEADLTIQNIEIQTIQDRKTQPFVYKSQMFHLHPLENAEQAIHLTNQVGFTNEETIRAIVTLQINGKTQVIESDAVEVQRY